MAETAARKPAGWSRHRERGSLLLLRLMARFSLRVGRRAGRIVLYGIAAYFFLFAPRARRASREYLRRVLGRPARASERFRQLMSFAATIHDRLYLLNGRFDLFDIEVRGDESMHERLRRGGGALLLGAHLGSFEVTRAIGGRRPGTRVMMMMYEHNARKINAALESINPAAAADILPLGDDPLALLKVRERLDQGVFVGMLADRTLGEEPTETVRFLGAPARFPTGPFRTAALLGRPVMLMLGLYLGGNRYRVVFEPLAEFAGVARAEREAAIRAAIARYAARLEHYCRAHPDNWFNFHDFWAHA